MGRNSEFTREEKIAAVKLITEEGRSLLSVANEYGIHENTLGKWKRQYLINPEAAFRKNNVGTEAEEAQDETRREMVRLQRRIKELEAENEFLKKVSAYFAKSPR